jgi:hypothetical protein
MIGRRPRWKNRIPPPEGKKLIPPGFRKPRRWAVVRRRMIAAALGIDPAAARPGWERSGPRPRLKKTRAAPSSGIGWTPPHKKTGKPPARKKKR